MTDDITKGNFTSATDFIFDATYRHGTVMPITTAEYMSLIEKYEKKIPKKKHKRPGNLAACVLFASSLF